VGPGIAEKLILLNRVSELSEPNFTKFGEAYVNYRCSQWMFWISDMLLDFESRVDSKMNGVENRDQILDLSPPVKLRRLVDKMSEQI